MATISGLGFKTDYSVTSQGKLFALDWNTVLAALQNMITESGQDYSAYGDNELLMALSNLMSRKLSVATGVNDISIPSDSVIEGIASSGGVIDFVASDTNTGPMTISIGTTYQNVPLLLDGQQVQAGTIKAGTSYPVSYDSATNTFNLLTNVLGVSSNSTSSIVTVSQDYTALPDTLLLCDTTNGPITVTLPDNPLANTVVEFIDVKSMFNTNNLIISSTSNLIMGLSEDMIVDVDNISFELIYVNSDWRIK